MKEKSADAGSPRGKNPPVDRVFPASLKEAFLKKIPYRLEPTNIEGVYNVPAFPDSFDPNTAPANALIKNGILWKRPGKNDSPARIQAWERGFSRNWSKTRIGPVLEPGKRRLPIRRGSSSEGYDDSSWGGVYIYDGNYWEGVMAYWTVPTASKPTDSPGSIGPWTAGAWIGIDGAPYSNSYDILQAGTEMKVDVNGNASYRAFFQWYCPYFKLTLSDTSPVGPAIINFQGVLFLAYAAGSDFNNFLYILISTDNGLTYSNLFWTTEKSTESPALAADDTNVYLAWKGDGNDNLNVARIIFDDETGTITGFSNKTVLKETSACRPSIASLNNILYIAWNGDGNNKLNVAMSTDSGVSFINKFVSTETSDQGPSIAAHDGNLMISWKGVNNNRINIAVVANQNAPLPNVFSGKSVLQDTTPVSPAILSFESRLYVAWKGYENNYLNIAYSNDNGQSFAQRYLSPETSPASPGLANDFFYVRIAWTGSENNELNISPVMMDGDQFIGFTSPAYVFPVYLSDFQVSPGDLIYCSIQYVGHNTAGQVTMANYNNIGQNVQLTIIPPPGVSMDGYSVEWIIEGIEQPDGQNSILPVFTELQFTTALGCAGLGETIEGNPKNGQPLSVEVGNQSFTNVTPGNNTVTIDYIG